MEIQGYLMPDELYYEENHYWVKIENDLLVMGMDDFAQKLAGDIVFVQLPPEGKTLTKGKKFAQVESGKWLGKVYAPVNGTLLNCNSELENSPGMINEECYGRGWMYKIKPENMADVNSLIHDPKDIEKWILSDIEKFKQD